MSKLIPILAALLAGCGEMHWAKPGGDTSTLAQDSASCRAAAREQLLRQYGPPRPSTGTIEPRFGTTDTSIPSPADRQVLEAQAADRCMRGRGYALVPGKEEAGK